MSKLIRKKEKWIAGAFVFSGRPDPTWSVNRKLVKKLENIWNLLETLSDKFSSPPPPPILGYRGCFVRNNDSNREWLVYGVVVTLKMNDSSESRLDRQYRFETLLLSSAPIGLLPPYCLNHIRT
jgi:hypothetical protein